MNELNGYKLSRQWFDFCYRNLPDAYARYLLLLEARYIDGREYNEVMVFVSTLRRKKLINIEIVYMFIREAEYAYEVYREGIYLERQIRRNQASAFIAKEEVRQQVFELHGESCLCCGSEENITIDHVVPVSRGGEDSINNFQPLCQPCNSSKGTKIIDYRTDG